MKKNKKNTASFHGYKDRQRLAYGIDWSKTEYRTYTKTKKTTLKERELTYRFYSHFHPYVKELLKALIEGSISDLQNADTEYLDTVLPNGLPKPKYYEEFFNSYSPAEKFIPSMAEGSTKLLHPVKELDFSSSGGYSVYNWELFFHVPLMLAVNLSKNQRFEEAMKWFHYIFDPGDDSAGPSPERFWKVKPFQQTHVRKIEELLTNLSSNADAELRTDTINSINEWKKNPFKPHVIARYRQTAFMFKTVMSYLDNLIDWGDSLFLQDTGETINEASQLYIMAANILGPRPQAVPSKGTVKTQTYDSLKSNLDAFGNALKEIEVEIPFDLAPLPGNPTTVVDGVSTLNTIGSTLYFCIPKNNKLLGYWDTVSDRLYKIHNSLNFQGVFRQLPLFEPEIDPAMLVRAAAAGLDIASIISGLNQPLPLIRFRQLLQKASEICQEVKSLGTAMLSCIEKEDSEALGLIRARHEIQLQQLTESIKYAQWQDSIKAREGVEVSLKNTVKRYKHYEKLLGTTDIKEPEAAAFDTSAMDSLKFKSTEPEIVKDDIKYDAFAEALDAAGLGDKNSLRLNTAEAIGMILDASTIPLEAAAITMDVIGGVLTIVPEIAARVTPIGVGGGVSLSGLQLGRVLQMMGSATRGGESILKSLSGLSHSVAGHQRRRQDWQLQSQSIAGEINSVYKQLIAAQIKEYVAKKEYDNFKVQMQHSKDIESFLNGEKIEGFTKTTTKDFYAFMRRETKNLHSKYFKFAYDVAKKAERALQHELGNPELSYLEFNYMAGKEGLYAGEKLSFDIKRMEMAYHDTNVRELELIKHISVSQINPSALLQLRLTGRCRVRIPEEVFDIGGCEGHYFRRIKTVALSIPCIAGPYTSINCTLTLLSSSVRIKSTLLGSKYVRQENDTDRFSDLHSSTSIVTSGGQNDKGMFDFNTNDERYFPFEYAGAISEWEIELSDQFRQFDYHTISDVIFHINYTARLGGGLLKKGAVDNLEEKMKAQENVRMFSLKHDFPVEYNRLISQTADAGGRFSLGVQILEAHYPYWSLGRIKSIKSITIDVLAANAVNFFAKNDVSKKFTSVKNVDLTREIYPGKTNTIFTGNWENIPLPAPFGKIELLVDNKEIDDLWISVTW